MNNPRPFNVEQYARFVAYRAWFEFVFHVARQPLKFPAPTRRRKDHERPKAA